jgi:hypothetical protein
MHTADLSALGKRYDVRIIKLMSIVGPYRCSDYVVKSHTKACMFSKEKQTHVGSCYC